MKVFGITITRENGKITVRGSKASLIRLARHANAARAARPALSTHAERRLQAIAALIGEHWVAEQFRRVQK